MQNVAVFKPTLPNTQSALIRAMAAVGKILDRRLIKPIDVVNITREGVEPDAIDALIKRGYSAGELTWVVKPRTLSHRRQKHERLSSEETGRWFRAAKIQALAFEVFGEKEKAYRWLHKTRKLFGGIGAIEMMQTEAGAQLVEDTLNQIDAGYYA